MPRVLIADDDSALLDVLAMSLQEAGYDVLTAPDGARAHELLVSKEIDLLVTDVTMPRLDGFALVRKLRAEKRSLPVIVLTSRASELDEVLGLELGADDFITKPFSTRALLARVAALLRRAHPQPTEGDSGAFETGDLSMDPQRMSASFRGVALTLTLTEFRMLAAFARRPGLVLSRDRLLSLAREDDSKVDDRIVDTYVRRLRRKLTDVAADFDRIETVVGLGYRWRE